MEFYVKIWLYIRRQDIYKKNRPRVGAVLVLTESLEDDVVGVEVVGVEVVVVAPIL